MLWSLEAVDYPLDEVIENHHQQLDEKIAATVPGYGVAQDAPHPVADYIRGTVTIWVDLGIQVSRGLGYANRAIGSGFFIDKKGYIITNYHVIDVGQRIYAI